MKIKDFKHLIIKKCKRNIQGNIRQKHKILKKQQLMNCYQKINNFVILVKKLTKNC